MMREEAKELMPIIQAFADGKKLEFLNKDNTWEECEEPLFCSEPKRYRIKPEPKYRAFKSQEECWNEMMKHHPFGWVKKKDNYVNITLIPKESSYNLDLKNFTFADGTPFGIREE